MYGHAFHLYGWLLTTQPLPYFSRLTADCVTNVILKRFYSRKLKLPQLKAFIQKLCSLWGFGLKLGTCNIVQNLTVGIVFKFDANIQ